MTTASSARPAVSVVVPFLGDAEAARGLREALSPLELAADDEVIVADNTDDDAFLSENDKESVTGKPVGAPAQSLRVVPANAERSSYHARNAAAASARNEWLLFMDADCLPAADLVDAYFAEDIDEGTGAVAGEIVGDPAQRSLAARYARDRKVLSQTDGLYGRGRFHAATGNLMVRREAFERLGGFREGIRSGGDVDFCLRLQMAGWRLAFRPRAVVRHRHRESVPGLLATFVRYGAGSRWLNESYPGMSPRWPLPKQFTLAWVDAARSLLRGDRQEAAFRAIDALGLVAHNVGYRSSNAVEAR